MEELADELGIARRDAHVSEAELRGADEIWLAAATREVQPVTRLDGDAVGSGSPGRSGAASTTPGSASSPQPARS